MSGLEELMESCENCCREFPESKIPTHFRYCRLNFIRCAECSQMYDRHLQEEHQAEYHRMEKCQHCLKKFTMGEVKEHEEGCQERKKFCQYCDLNVPIQIFDNHFRDCEGRTKTCEKCRQSIANKDYQVHAVNCSSLPSMSSRSLPYGFMANPISSQRRGSHLRQRNYDSLEAEESQSYPAEDSNWGEADLHLNRAIEMSLNSSHMQYRDSEVHEDMMFDEHFIAEQRAIEQALSRSRK